MAHEKQLCLVIKWVIFLQIYKYFMYILILKNLFQSIASEIFITLV